MSEQFLSVDANNKILGSFKPFPFCFSCKQGRLSDKDFWDHYQNMIKHERIKCLLCVSGLTKIEKNKQGD